MAHLLFIFRACLLFLWYLIIIRLLFVFKRVYCLYAIYMLIAFILECYRLCGIWFMTHLLFIFSECLYVIFFIYDTFIVYILLFMQYFWFVTCLFPYCFECYHNRLLMNLFNYREVNINYLLFTYYTPSFRFVIT